MGRETIDAHLKVNQKELNKLERLAIRIEKGVRSLVKASDELYDRILYGKEYVEMPKVVLDALEETMKDSGKRQQFNTGAVRDTAEDKPRVDLISPFAQWREGIWLMQGAKNYKERNWEKGIPIARCIASLERHIQQYKMGDTSEDHMAAIRTNAGFIIHFEEMVKRGLLPKELDDMPKYTTGDVVLKLIVGTKRHKRRAK